MKPFLIAFLCIVSLSYGQANITEGFKRLPLRGESFQFNGNDAFIILPKNISTDTPWIWYAPTLKGLPSSAEVWMFKRFLDKGIAIAGIDIGESYGSVAGRKVYNEFYQYLISQRKFSQTPCLFARSRGGLMLYNWAVVNPKKVSGVAGIYPVCNLKSYPGLIKTAKAYGMSVTKLKSELNKHNPIERLAPLAKAGVPILHLHGAKDKLVPYDQNTALLVEKYKKMGGTAKAKLYKKQGHNMWKGWFQSEEFTIFAIQCALKVDKTVSK